MDDASEMDMQEKKPGGIGPMAGIIIVIILFVAGGIYFLIDQHIKFNTPPIEENLNI